MASTSDNLDRVIQFIDQVHAVSLLLGGILALHPVLQIPVLGMYAAPSSLASYLLLLFTGVMLGESIFWAVGHASAVVEWFRRKRRESKLENIDNCEAAALRLALYLPMPEHLPDHSSSIWEPVFASLKRKDLLASYDHNIYLQSRYGLELQDGVEEYLKDNVYLINLERMDSVQSEEIAKYN
jgi:hypothetical protein